MQNYELFPFERNRYYSGKLLTSADFESEQTYMNNKRRFVNKMLFGRGIVCGLGVFNLDDLSLMIESGIALDETGREIVVNKSVVKKLSAIDGFDKLKTNYASLCIEYNEELVHPVYSVNKEQANKEYEYNRISESYRIFLTDTADVKQAQQCADDFIDRRRIFADSEYVVSMRMPRIAPAGKTVKLIFTLEKLGDTDADFDIDATIQIPAFLSETGEREINVNLHELRLKKGGKYEKIYYITAASGKAMDTNIIVKSTFTRIMIDGSQAQIGEDVLLPVAIREQSAREIISEEIGKISLEAHFTEQGPDCIKLADVALVRADSAYIIESLTPAAGSLYIHTLAQQYLEDEYSEYFARGDGMPAPQKTKQSSDETTAGEQLAHTPKSEEYMATGVLEIPIGLRSRPGDIMYSDEIMHGLGAGNVHVDVGLEYVKQHDTEEPSRNVIYGDTTLFAAKEPSVPMLSSAVRVQNDNGTFIAGIKLLEETNLISVKLRWVATKFMEGDSQASIVRFSDRSIVADPSTVVLIIKESYCFEVKFRNMEPVSCHYELTEPDSGEITTDGIYTAPSKEGVYEIKISCVDAPYINTYAYAVVKKKGVE